MGFGVNTGAIGLDEQVSLSGITFGLGFSETVTLAKAAGIATAVKLFDTEMKSGNLNVAMRPGQNDDRFQVFSSIFSQGSATFSRGGNINFHQSLFAFSMTITVQAATVGDIVFSFEGDKLGSNSIVVGSSRVIIESAVLLGAIVVTGDSIVNLINCAIDSGATLNVVAPAQASLMGSQYGPNFLSGTGSVDRTSTSLTQLVPIIGTGTVTFITPYISSNYTVLSTPTASAGPLVITAKTPTGFDFEGSILVSYDIVVFLSQSALTMS